jgi:hypothetical protein
LAAAGGVSSCRRLLVGIHPYDHTFHGACLHHLGLNLSARAGRAMSSRAIPSWATTSPAVPDAAHSDEEPQPKAGQPRWRASHRAPRQQLGRAAAVEEVLSSRL